MPKRTKILFSIGVIACLIDLAVSLYINIAHEVYPIEIIIDSALFIYGCYILKIIHRKEGKK